MKAEDRDKIDSDLIERAAQLWCKPPHSNKTMDSELAWDIARLAQDVRNENHLWSLEK